MLRRRIFSSAMASVMALSSIAVVANAEETVNQYKTADDLKELVEKKYSVDWRVDELPAYGSKATEAVTDALETAETILDNEASTEKDYTYAYFMVESVVAEYEIKTNEDLKKLVKEWADERATENLYNEILNDLIYLEDKWADFESAYDNAKDTIDSEHAVDITDAWYELNDAANALKKYDTVTKAQYRAAMKAYEEKVISAAVDYDYWRLGTLGWADDQLKNGGNFWALGNGTTPYGSLIDRLLSMQDQFKKYYADLDAVKGLTETSDKAYVESYQAILDAVTFIRNWTPDNVGKGSKSAVKNLLEDYHGQFVLEDATLKAMADELVDAVAEAHNPVMATKKGDAYDSAKHDLKVISKGAEKTYVASTTVEDVWNITWGGVIVGDNNGTPVWADRIAGAELVIVPQTTIYIPIKDGAYSTAPIEEGGAERTIVVSDTAPAGYTSTTWRRVGAGIKFDITELINVDYATLTLAPVDGMKGSITAADMEDDYKTPPFIKKYEMTNAFWDDMEQVFGNDNLGVKLNLINYGATSTYGLGNVFGEANYLTNLDDAIKLANLYMNTDAKTGEVFDMFDAIDSANALSPNATELKKNSAEWTTVYRYLYYALWMRYGTDNQEAAATYTRADVEKLINDCHVLAEEVGDTAIFAVSHDEMVVERQDAREWLRVAKTDRYNKKDSLYDYKGGEANATTVYNTLKKAYDQLVAEKNALSISIGEIYDTLAKAAADIDADKLENTAALQNAMLKTANALYKLNPITFTKELGEYGENYAFDDDTEIVAINRVITVEGKDNAVNIKTIAKELGVESAKVYADGNSWEAGNNTSHYNLKKAYEALKAAIADQAAPATAKGDVDNDGTPYTVKDALAALKIANKLQELTVDIEVLDHNGNAEPDVSDALTILKKANGLA